ncbi:hypothetical protein N7523_010661 [Penicillium sp. IBT 18751x]|nr:hypothetical protein N7523_010661 [Penicillium sp. IBT 18751x]
MKYCYEGSLDIFVGSLLQCIRALTEGRKGSSRFVFLSLPHPSSRMDSYRGPSRRLARRAADDAVKIAAARLIAAAEALLNGTGTIREWRQAYLAELGARTAAEAIRRGFGHFRG